MADIKNCMGPLWKPRLWDELNKKKYLKNSNCYTYAFNYVDYGEEKLQPGEIHGTKYSKTTCDEIVQKMKNDYITKNIEKVGFEEELSSNRYKIALFIDPDESRKGTSKHDKDYHFYRQDCDGTWSHKPGTNEATNEDASGNAILNPEEADKNYRNKCKREEKANGEGEGEGEDDCEDEHNYTTFCGYFSVPLNSLDGPVIRFIEKDEE